MHKFIIKNRQKRKYVRKTKVVSSFSFTKTVYGMMPILVMIVVFMATIIISTSFRSAFENIHITIQFPEISLHNPASMIQILIQDIAQVSVAVWTVVVALLVTISSALHGIVELIVILIRFLDPRPFLQISGSALISFGITLWNMISLLRYGISIYNNALAQAVIFIGTFFISVMISLATVLMEVLLMLMQGISAAMISVWQIISTIVTVITISVSSAIIAFGHAIVLAMMFTFQAITKVIVILIHYCLIIFQALWNGLIFTVGAIVATISHITAAVVHVIKIPFKILYAFWLQIKPYMMIFGHHIQMSGSDLSNGFASLGKFGSLISSSK